MEYSLKEWMKVSSPRWCSVIDARPGEVRVRMERDGAQSAMWYPSVMATVPYGTNGALFRVSRTVSIFVPTDMDLATKAEVDRNQESPILRVFGAVPASNTTSTTTYATYMLEQLTLPAGPWRFDIRSTVGVNNTGGGTGVETRLRLGGSGGATGTSAVLPTTTGGVISNFLTKSTVSGGQTVTVYLEFRAVGGGTAFAARAEASIMATRE